MTDPHCPPEFVAAEAWKVLLRPLAHSQGPGDAGKQEDSPDDTTDSQEASFWEASWNAR